MHRFYRSFTATGIALVAALTAVFTASVPAQASVEQYQRYATFTCEDTYYRAEFWINRDTVTGSRQPYRFAVVRLTGTRTMVNLDAYAYRGTTETAEGHVYFGRAAARADASVYFSPRVWYPAQAMHAQGEFDVVRYNGTDLVTCHTPDIYAYP